MVEEDPIYQAFNPKDYITFDPNELAILERDKAADISIEVFLVIILFSIFYNISFLFYFS